MYIIRGGPFDSWEEAFYEKKLLSKKWNINGLFNFLWGKQFVHEMIEKNVCSIKRNEEKIVTNKFQVPSSPSSLY